MCKCHIQRLAFCLRSSMRGITVVLMADVLVIWVRVSPILSSVRSDARVDADARTREQRDVSRSKEGRDAFYGCGG